MATKKKCLLIDNGDVIETLEEDIYRNIDAYNEKRRQRYVTLKEAILGIGGTTIYQDMDKCGWRKRQSYLPEITHMVAINLVNVKGDPHAEMPLYKVDHLELGFLNITDLNVERLSANEEV